MPFEVDDRAPFGRLRVRASAASELLWVTVYLAHNDIPDIAALSPVRDRARALAKQVKRYWKGSADFTAGLVLAARGGTLEAADAGPFLDSLPRVAAQAPGSLPLPSETAAERAAVQERLRQFAASRDLRCGYRDLLQAVWTLVKPGWQREGKPLVERTAAAWQRDANAGRGVDQILFRGHIYFHLTAQLSGLDPAFPIVLSPSFFASRGGHVVVMPQLVHVAAGVGPENVSEALRHRADALAQQLRVLADPTRLAILFHLNDAAYTVGELAARFQVTQPTISGHIKALRDQGLVEAHRAGQRVPYAANRERIASLLRDTERALIVPPMKASSASAKRGRSRSPSEGSA